MPAKRTRRRREGEWRCTRARGVKKSSRMTRVGSGGVAAPVGDFFQTFSSGVLEESYFVAGIFEFVDVGPDFSLPGFVVSCRLAAAGATGVEGDVRFCGGRLRFLQFDKDAAHLFDLFFRAQDVLVAQQESETQFARLDLGFLAGVERPIFGPQLLGRVAGHPENIFVRHSYPRCRLERTRSRPMWRERSLCRGTQPSERAHP